ncbi:MAG: hypothetical protein C0404_15035, partial [Verrucomicrobia bacterium]|nr:hypothetical protein [Verrucomicrobiota bacterium]
MRAVRQHSLIGRYLLFSVAAAMVFNVSASPVNSLLNPRDYSMLTGSLDVASGTLTIDTKDGASAPTFTLPDTTVLNGRVVTNQSGNVVLALFNFGALGISNGVTCVVTGNLGLVLAARSNMTIG